MATLVLATVGTAVAGPLGGLVGTFLGASIDRRIFGGSGRQGSARNGNLAVQSSAYGEPIPRCYGRLRVAGNLIWSPGIIESAGQSGGGKQKSGSGFSYAASFAVALAARQIESIGRIWADGKLLRSADGGFVVATVMRTYLGSEAQAADPLIIAAEGVGNAPAYRGLAYVVFENLALADFANRIPNLTFEIIADSADAVAAEIALDLFAAARIEPPKPAGSFPAFHGFAATRAGDLRSQIENLVSLADLTFADDGSVLELRSGGDTQALGIAAGDLGASLYGEASGIRQLDTRDGHKSVPDALAIGFFDPARDYQLGLQRVVRRNPVLRSEQRDLPVALAAPTAKLVAERLLSQAQASRSTAELHLPWRHLAVRVGDRIIVGEDPLPWRVRSLAFEAMVLRLSVERVVQAPRRNGNDIVPADPGRSLVSHDLPNGPTLLEVLDLPGLPGVGSTVPRLWVAVAGTGSGWRSATIEVSTDDGDSYRALATITSATVMGTADAVLEPVTAALWDRRSVLDVTLASDAMWLEPRSEAAVLAGANLALVGDELIQFANVEVLAPRRFRLSVLLRGRRGTEAEISRHAAGERFMLIETGRMLGFDLPLDLLGRSHQFRAAHRSDQGAAVVQSIVPIGRALQPLSPAHLTLQARPDGGLRAQWIRRSREGFSWIGATDVPLGEERESYHIQLRNNLILLRQAQVLVPAWDYTVADRIADGAIGPVSLTLRVTQISGAVGAGQPKDVMISLSAL